MMTTTTTNQRHYQCQPGVTWAQMHKIGFTDAHIFALCLKNRGKIDSEATFRPSIWLCM